MDLVVIRFDDRVSVLYGRCLHRGALMADGEVSGPNLICGLAGSDVINGLQGNDTLFGDRCQ